MADKHKPEDREMNFLDGLTPEQRRAIQKADLEQEAREAAARAKNVVLAVANRAVVGRIIGLRPSLVQAQMECVTATGMRHHELSVKQNMEPGSVPQLGCRTSGFRSCGRWGGSSGCDSAT